ncbi:hypothetical protein KEM60_00657 [Austwickia sp. TVS 96-490-7B]|nr:hypothetical protein [Austwickia sp. TVS 96-490-7B]
MRQSRGSIAPPGWPRDFLLTIPGRRDQPAPQLVSLECGPLRGAPLRSVLLATRGRQVELLADVRLVVGWPSLPPLRPRLPRQRRHQLWQRRLQLGAEMPSELFQAWWLLGWARNPLEGSCGGAVGKVGTLDETENELRRG